MQEILASFPTLTEQDVQAAVVWADDSSKAHSLFDLIGAFSSDKPLIDNIPVSADPDLYLLSETIGEQAQGATCLGNCAKMVLLRREQGSCTHRMIVRNAAMPKNSQIEL